MTYQNNYKVLLIKYIIYQEKRTTYRNCCYGLALQKFRKASLNRRTK